ncbi:nuclear transport factor 2 family protein [Mycolicibacter kumamotonensis]|nr:nuclear transport factor 2 family protein [Mycolicibacter kumamotonensis]
MMTTRWHAGISWLLVTSVLIVSCSSSLTAGTPVAEHSSAPAPAAAAPPPPPEPPPPPSDEDQIRQTVQAFQDAYNTQNWDSYKEQMCPAMRDQFTDGPVMDLLKKTRIDNGLTRATVSAVEIDGDIATVTLDSQNEALGNLAPTLRLQRADGWKICVR